MKLTKRQIALLKFYQEYQSTPLKLSAILRFYWLAWILLLVPILIGWWCISAGWPAVGGGYIGAGIGAFLRDWNRIRVVHRGWPLAGEIMDWPKVKKLLGDHAEGA